jgi:oligopeptidase B
VFVGFGNLDSKSRFRKMMYSAPVAKKVADTIYFGKTPLIPDQYRGPNPMEPPKTKSDSYNWLRDETRKDETVLNHIKAENDYCNNEMSHLKPLQDELYKEMLSHLKETDEDMPYPYGDYLYYSKTIKGKSYKIHCRKPLSADALTGEQIMLDENILAENQTHCDVHATETSPDHTLLAYSVDYDGSETYKVTVINLATGEVLPDIIEDISGDTTVLLSYHLSVLHSLLLLISFYINIILAGLYGG